MNVGRSICNYSCVALTSGWDIEIVMNRSTRYTRHFNNKLEHYSHRVYQ